MAKDGSKLGGLSDAFFSDEPYETTGSLDRRQLVKLQDIAAGQNEAALSSRQLVQEAGRSREVAERMIAPLLRELGSEFARGNEGVQERLTELQSALGEGNKYIASTLSAVGDQITGTPRRTKRLAELLANGSVDEAETVILAATSVLERAEAEKFFRSLPDWKIDVVKSGLVTRVDVKAEKALTTQQKVFLAQLRRKTSSNPADFRSLSTLARQGFLDEDFRRALAERIPDLRSGLEAVTLEVRDVGRDLGDKASTLVGQGDEMIRRSDVGIGLSRQLVTQGSVGITQRDIALRLMKAGVLKTEELVGVGRETLSVLGDSLSVQRATLQTGEAMLGGIGRLGEFAERAETDRSLIVQNTGSTARNTGYLANLAEDAAIERRAIRTGIGDLTDATHRYGSLQAIQMDEAQGTRRDQLATAQHFGSLQAAQMDEAQGTRLAQLDLARALVEIDIRNGDILEGISGQMEDLTAIIENQLTGINQGLNILRAIGGALLETSGRISVTLDNLSQILALGFTDIVNIVDAVRQTIIDMEARAVEREQNSEKNLAHQTFQKAMGMLKIGKIDRAIHFFDESEERWPLDFRVYFQRGLCYVLQDDPRSAEVDFIDAIKLANQKTEGKTRSLIRLNLARLYYGEAKVHFADGHQAEYEEKLLGSIEEAKRAVGEDPKFLEAQFGLATYLAAYKLFDEALVILVKIIRKDPKFIEKLDHFDVFTPLREALKNTLGESAAPKNVNHSQANLNIAKDCVALGDFETAKKCINSLFEKDPEYLRNCRIWEMPEFTVLSDDLCKMAKSFLALTGKHESEWGYAVIGIALHFVETDRGAIYLAFKTAFEKDADSKSKDPRKITEKCVQFADDKIAVLFRILKFKYPSDLPNWLIKSI